MSLDVDKACKTLEEATITLRILQDQLKKVEGERDRYRSLFEYYRKIVLEMESVFDACWIAKDISPVTRLRGYINFCAQEHRKISDCLPPPTFISWLLAYVKGFKEAVDSKLVFVETKDKGVTLAEARAWVQALEKENR